LYSLQILFFCLIKIRNISVPGAAGRYGNHLSNGSLTRELHQSVKFEADSDPDGYDPESVLNGTNKERSHRGSGYKAGTKYAGPGCQGGSTFIDDKYKSTIKQSTEIPIRGVLEVVFQWMA